MENYETLDRVRERDVAAQIELLTEELLNKCREALRFGGRQARRQIVTATIKLESLLREAQP